MTRFSLVLLMFAGLGCSISFAQSETNPKRRPTPLDLYIEDLRTHTLNVAAAAFGSVCGIKLDETSVRFAFSNEDAGTWKVVEDLPHAYDSLGMDLIGTAEVWKNPVGTMVEEWVAALDVGGFDRTFYCFDQTGRLKVSDVTNYQIPNDERRPWGMHERWVLRKGGLFMATIPFQFVGLDDRIIAKPKLAGDDERFATRWGRKPPRIKTAQELNLPPLLLQ